MTNTEKKFTRKQNFEYVLSLVGGDERATEFLQHELDLIANRKSSPRVNPHADEYAELEAAIADFMTPGKLYLVSDLIASVPALVDRQTPPSTSFVSARLRKLIEQGTIQRTVQKGRSYFSIKEE